MVIWDNKSNFDTAVTEESTPVETDRDAGTWIEILARWKPEEVPSRASRVKGDL